MTSGPDPHAEVPLLAAPTVVEIADRLGAHSVVAPASPREVNRVTVGAMGLPAFLDRIRDGDLVITPGDRADLVAGLLAAHASTAYPAVAGLLLSGGMVAEPVRRLAPGFDGAGIPVLAVASDTYETAAAVLQVRGAIRADSARKIATAIALFEDNVDHGLLRERLAVARVSRSHGHRHRQHRRDHRNPGPARALSPGAPAGGADGVADGSSGPVVRPPAAGPSTAGEPTAGVRSS